nr:opioid binding protein/cell adhesion molecule like [Rousettus aegyptiacus]
MLMILTSCVYVQGKKKIRDAACLLPSLARSLLLPLFCSLPAFANIGFKPAQNSAQRKAAAVAAAEAVASPAAETPQPQDVPPCLLDHLLRDNRPALHPR